MSASDDPFEELHDIGSSDQVWALHNPGQAQQSWQIDHFGNTSVIQGQSRDCVTAPLTFLGKQRRVIANAVALGFKTTGNESDSHDAGKRLVRMGCTSSGVQMAGCPGPRPNTRVSG